MPRFSIRDMFWLTLVVALVLGWWADHQRQTVAVKSLASELRYAKVLGQSSALEFIQTPLKDVASYVSDVHRVPVKLDRESLEKVGLDGASPITFRSIGRPLGETLDHVLKGRARVITTEDGLLIAGDEAYDSATASTPQQQTTRAEEDARLDIPKGGALRDNEIEFRNRKLELLQAHLAERGETVKWAFEARELTLKIEK